MLLNRTLDGVLPAFRELFARYNVTEQQWRVLRVLWSAPKVTSAEISARTLLPAPSLVGIIDRLEGKGLVTRVRSVEDRRVVYVIATAEGRQLQEEVMPQVAKIHERMQQAVSRQEWIAMEKTLTTITDAMSSEPESVSKLRKSAAK